MQRNQAIGFALLALVGVFGMNLLADRISTENKTDQVTGEMFTNDGKLVVRTGVVESFAGLLALLRASPEQLSKLTYAFFSTTWLDGRVSWDSWKIASSSRFGHAELLLRFASCGFELLITDTELALRKDGEKVGTVEVGTDEIALHKRALEQATSSLMGDDGIVLESPNAFWTTHISELENRKRLLQRRKRSLQRRGAVRASGAGFSLAGGTNRSGND